ETAKSTAQETGRQAAREVMAAAPPNAASQIYAKAPVVAAPNRFTVTGEYLALKAGVGDTSFVLDARANPPTSLFGTKFGHDPGFGTAYRVGAGYEFGGTNRAINASSPHPSATATTALAGPNLWATAGSPDFNRSFANLPGSATSQIGVSY